MLDGPLRGARLTHSVERLSSVRGASVRLWVRWKTYERRPRMTTHLARYVQRAREVCGLSPQALAALLGYRNLDKGANRVLALEREGQGSRAFLGLLVRTLDL